MFTKARDILIALWKKNNGNWENIYLDLQNKNMDNLEDYHNESDNDKYITILDNDYPQSLKQTFKPPFVIEKRRLQ